VNRGRLLAFEGLDGSGKTTQVKKLVTALRGEGNDVVETREPTSGPVGQRIRAMLGSGEAVPPRQELDWFMEDRREHVREVIEPALREGRVVVTDRYYLSTVAYQGARGHDAIAILRDCEAEFPIPDLVILLEVEPRAGLDRVQSRGGSKEEIFEQIELQQRVAEQFSALDCPYIARIDGRREADDVARDIALRVGEVLAKAR
jgi:dTMP kinase